MCTCVRGDAELVKAAKMRTDTRPVKDTHATHTCWWIVNAGQWFSNQAKCLLKVSLFGIHRKLCYMDGHGASFEDCDERGKHIKTNKYRLKKIHPPRNDDTDIFALHFAKRDFLMCHIVVKKA